jgi:F0F1-type ATP synthase membrane subunit a
LVKNLIKENLNIKVQIYFLNIFYLFFFIFIANITGLIPLSFTPTSSFILAFFLAGMHFIGSFFIGLYT